ncbi:MAG: ABC transporter, partial [Planctomycetota bacterium]
TALCERVVVIHEGRVLYDGTLDGVVQRFAPLREVRLELRHAASAERLSDFAEVESVDGKQVRLLVQREVLTDTVGRLLGELEVDDLTVADPPIEEVIGRLFETGKDAAG